MTPGELPARFQLSPLLQQRQALLHCRIALACGCRAGMISGICQSWIAIFCLSIPSGRWRPMSTVGWCASLWAGASGQRVEEWRQGMATARPTASG